ncbi:hypothetical protein [Streptomyces sp. NPDC059564]
MSQTRPDFGRKIPLPEPPPGPSPHLLARAARGWARFLAGVAR